ncbi:MAG TPA: agmatinase family protein [bacterium]|nr:agmatinase family protein [bacterium]
MPRRKPTRTDRRSAASGARPRLKPPGLIVNWLKGDPVETRANSWLEWTGTWELDAVFLGAPFDGAGTVRSGSRHAPDAVRSALPGYTTYSTSDGVAMDHLRAADVGDVATIVTDMETTFRNISDATRFLSKRGIRPAIIGGDNSISYPAVRGLCEGLRRKTIALIQIDAHHDLRESHLGALSSGVPYRLLLERHPDQVRGSQMTQIGIADFNNNPTHHRYAQAHGIAVLSNIEVWRRGIRHAIDVALDRAGEADAIYISIDVDGVDQSSAPGTAAPNPFGLDGRDVIMAVRELAAQRKCAGLEIVELSPPTDHFGMTANWAAAVVMNFFYGLAQQKAR